MYCLCKQPLRVRFDQLEHALDHPAVQPFQQLVTVGGTQVLADAYQLAVVVLDAQQNLEACRLRGCRERG